tara:strand:- start:394 stop:1371 length:978 start_codon:yes stop_codon:yes gene_type:complete
MANSPIKRGSTYWIDIMINGNRIRESLKTDDKKLAQQLYDMRSADAWKVGVLKVKPKKTFKDACAKWLVEMGSKKSIADDKGKIALLLPKMGDKLLADIDRDLIEDLLTGGLLPAQRSAATRNRYRALIRAILRKCEREWGWMDRGPTFRTEKEPFKRVAFLTREQAQLLVGCLPEWHRNPVRFALLTGLRKSNVYGMCWEEVNLAAASALVHADEAKAGNKILVPLNKSAVAMLESLQGPRQGRVWGEVRSIGSTTWERACVNADLPGFRFHDLRHTWASWHAMGGTPLSVLQELGGWHSPQMVQKYAHLSPAHLADAAEKVTL